MAMRRKLSNSLMRINLRSTALEVVTKPLGHSYINMKEGRNFI